MAAPCVVKEEHHACAVKLEVQEHQIRTPATASVIEISSSDSSDNRCENPASLGHNEITSPLRPLQRKRGVFVSGKRSRVQFEDPEHQTRDIGTFRLADDFTTPSASPCHDAASLRGSAASPVPHSRVAVSAHTNSDKVIRQFWKAGDYEVDQSMRKPAGRMDHVRVHPKFLHSNATSHKWALGAIAELLDNALDEVANGATYVNVDIIKNPKNSGPMLLIEDDGGGMNPENMRQCMSLGYSAKCKIADAIGQYGNGFKTSTMRLGADAIVFSRCRAGKVDCPTQSVGILSYTFLRETGQQDIIVPMIDYEIQPFGLEKLIRRSADDWNRNMETIKRWSPYSTDAELLVHFKEMRNQGTKILIYNLWEDEEGEIELDVDADPYDIQLRGANRDEKNIEKAKQFPNSWHYLTYKHSLRSYASILYLRLPPSFKMFLRGKRIQHHNLIDDLMYTQISTYRPQATGDVPEREPLQMKAVVTIGFVKDAKEHIDIQGFNVYHKNRLIKPFWRIWNASSSHGRGIVGVLEANFVEPAHDKQGFERTVVLTRLENRLLEMQRAYWWKNCHVAGYVNPNLGSKKGSYKDSKSMDKIFSRTEQLGTTTSQRHQTLETLSASRTVSERSIFLSPHGNTSANQEAHTFQQPSVHKTPLHTCTQVQIAVSRLSPQPSIGKEQVMQATSSSLGANNSVFSQGPAAEESRVQQSPKPSSNRAHSHSDVHKLLKERGMQEADAQVVQDCIHSVSFIASLPGPCKGVSHGDLSSPSRHMEIKGTGIQPMTSLLQTTADQVGLDIAGSHDASSISIPLKSKGSCAERMSNSLWRNDDQVGHVEVMAEDECPNLMPPVEVLPQTVQGLLLHPSQTDQSSISTNMRVPGACTEPMSSSLQRSANQLPSDVWLHKMHAIPTLASVCQTEEVCRVEAHVASVFGVPLGGESAYNTDAECLYNSSTQSYEDNSLEVNTLQQNTLLNSLTYKDSLYQEAPSIASEPPSSVDLPPVIIGRSENPFIGRACVTSDSRKETSSCRHVVKSMSLSAVTDFPQTSGSEVTTSPCELADRPLYEHGPSSCIPTDTTFSQVIGGHSALSVVMASQTSMRRSRIFQFPLNASAQLCSEQDVPSLEGPFDISMKEREMAESIVSAQEVSCKDPFLNKAIEPEAHFINVTVPSSQMEQAVCNPLRHNVVIPETVIDVEEHKNLSQESLQEQVASSFVPQKMGDILEQEKGSVHNVSRNLLPSFGQKSLKDPHLQLEQELVRGEKSENGLSQKPSGDGILGPLKPIIELKEHSFARSIVEMKEADSNALVVHDCELFDQMPDQLTELEEEIKLLEKELNMAVAEKESLKQQLEQVKMEGWHQKMELQKRVEEAWAKVRQFEAQTETSLVELA